jgi:LmbE family N-acetylglucosaminyl deacetylase
MQPEASLPLNLDISEAREVLVFAPHPDDECIGCGGILALLARHAAVNIKVVLITNGDGGANSPEPDMGPRRENEMKKALSILGIEQLECLRYPDGRFELNNEFINRIDSILTSFKPQWVLLPSPIDYHKDHLLASNVISSQCLSHQNIEKLIFYETWCPVPATHTLDITDVMNIKIKALQQHESAMKYGDYVRCITALNTYRGLYLGFNRFAEAFLVYQVKDSKRSEFPLNKVIELGSFLKHFLSTS